MAPKTERKLSFSPFMEDFKSSSASSLRADLISGLTVALLVITLGTLVGFLLHDFFPMRTLQEIAPIQASFPSFQKTLFIEGTFNSLFNASIAISIIGLIETVSIGQVLPLKHKQKLNFNQEYVAQGFSHTVGSFFQCFPDSRSSLIEQTGGQTRLANIIFGLGTVIAMFTIPGLLNLIPIAALAGILLFIGILFIDTAERVNCITKK